MRTETEMEGCGHKPKDTCRHQELEEAGKVLPWSPQRDHGPAASWPVRGWTPVA